MNNQRLSSKRTTVTMGSKAARPPKIEEEQIQHMERATHEAVQLDKRKAAAFLGYALVEIYPAKDQGSLSYNLKFGTYNDRALSEVEVRNLRNSLLVNGFLQFQTENTFPIGVKKSEIDESELTKDQHESQPGALTFLDTDGEQQPREVIAYGGHHRCAAVCEMKTYFEGQMERLRKSLKDYDERMQKSEKNQAKMVQYEDRGNQVRQILETTEERYEKQRWWKVSVYDIGKLTKKLFRG
jgi:hypothetical protein